MQVHPIVDFRDSESRHNHAIGLLARLIQGHRLQAGLSSVVNTVDHAMRTGGIQAYSDPVGRAIGMVCWETSNMPEQEKAIRALRPPAAACKGNRLWITSLFAQSEALRGILADMRDHLFTEYPDATYMRTGPGRRTLCKQLARTDNTSFMKAGGTASRPAVPLRPHAPSGLIEIGRVVRALAQSMLDSAAPLHALLAKADRLVATGMYEVIELEGKPVACLSWAWLSAEGVERLAQRSPESIDLCELNEGTFLCLYGCSSIEQSTPQLLERIRRLALGEERIGFFHQGHVTWAEPGRLSSFETDCLAWILQKRVAE